MSHTWWLPELTEGKLFAGKPDQIKGWSDLFQIRAKGNMEGRIYYVSTKGGAYHVEGTPEFKEWSDARQYLADNWKAMYDDIFEKIGRAHV